MKKDLKRMMIGRNDEYRILSHIKSKRREGNR